ncbi:hypothetical protein MASR2M41_08860 [Flammeovirgaceae bacterium]
MKRRCLYIGSGLILSAILGLCNLGQAQSITSDSIIWHVNSIFEMSTESTTQLKETIVTYGHDQLVSLNENGEVKKHFDITEVVGIWEDVNQPGSIVIRIAEGDLTGNLMIQKGPIKTRLKLVYVEGGQPNVFEFIVDDFELLNSQY